MFFFSKMQAIGNDFVVIDNREKFFQYSFKLLAEFLCNRHYGIGADGILIIENSIKSDFKMRIFNKDGTEAEMCGNGIRCFAKYLYEKDITKYKKFTIETLSGEKSVELVVEGETVVSISVDMGEPVWEFEKIPVNYFQKDKEEIIIEIDEEKIKTYPVSIGNPHLVVFVENVDNFDVEKYGKYLENYKYFINKTNVEFVEIIDNTHIKIRVWERGVGETLACGTGACASAVVSYKQKSTDSRLTVDLPGGKLQINCLKNIIMTGPAEFVFEGKLNI